MHFRAPLGLGLGLALSRVSNGNPNANSKGGRVGGGGGEGVRKYISAVFRHRDTIKLSKNKMDTKVIKSYQCSLKKFHAVSIELNYEL